MRTILLCILISVLSHWVWGQDNLRDSCWQSVSVDTVWTPHEISMARWYQQFRPLLDAYKFYSDECWADSTRHDNFLPQPHGYALPLWKDWATGVVDSNYVMYTHGGSGVTLELICEKLPRFHYTHREPTFAGFREFLERKVKP